MKSEEQSSAVSVLEALSGRSTSGELADIGRRRQEALAEADRQLDRLLHLVLNAGDAGIGVAAEIARMANVSRPTVYALLPRARDNVRDMRLAVLQLTIDGATAREICKMVRCPRHEVEAMLDFEQQQWVVQRHPGTGRREDPVWLLDAGGVDAIEEWDSDRSIQEYIQEYLGS